MGVALDRGVGRLLAGELAGDLLLEAGELGLGGLERGQALVEGGLLGRGGGAQVVGLGAGVHDDLVQGLEDGLNHTTEKLQALQKGRTGAAGAAGV